MSYIYSYFSDIYPDDKNLKKQAELYEEKAGSLFEKNNNDTISQAKDYKKYYQW